jgi:hypothetical protein
MSSSQVSFLFASFKNHQLSRSSIWNVNVSLYEEILKPLTWSLSCSSQSSLLYTHWCLGTCTYWTLYQIQDSRCVFAPFHFFHYEHVGNFQVTCFIPLLRKSWLAIQWNPAEERRTVRHLKRITHVRWDIERLHGPFPRTSETTYARCRSTWLVVLGRYSGTSRCVSKWNLEVTVVGQTWNEILFH